ncbi:hypothetical protein D3C80_1500730 [compost metagenome]
MVILAKLLSGFKQLGLCHIRVEVLDAWLQHQIVHLVDGLIRHLFLTRFDNLLLFFISYLFSCLACSGQRFLNRGIFVEPLFHQRPFGIAVNTPGGDPGNLVFDKTFQATAGTRRIVFCCLVRADVCRGGQIKGELSPGVEAVN